MDLERVADRSSGGREICGPCFSIYRGYGILLIGEDVLDRLQRPFLFACWCGNPQRFQLLLDFQEAPTLLIPFAYLQEA